jgi:flagellar basal body-associated protein FliL
MLPQRIKRQSALIVALVVVTVVAVVAAVIFLVWQLANSIDLS